MDTVTAVDLPITAEQRRVADAFIAEESARCRHLVVYLSGSHAYGFPSPDSDLDVKASHIEPTEHYLGLTSPTEAFNRLEVIDGVEIDYTSNEIGIVLAGVLGGNGNFIERILGDYTMVGSPELSQLRELVPAALSKRVFRHYRGFASSQRKALEETDKPTVKKLLYVLRTALTGTHLLRSGELRIDLSTLVGDYGLADASELIEAKRDGERTVLADNAYDRWRRRLDALFEQLEDAHQHSSLPDEPDAAPLHDWLVRTRAATLAATRG